MNYPALVQSLSGKRLYHITDDGKKTRCGHKCSSLVERHPINVTEMWDSKTNQAYPADQHCERCGDLAAYEAINQARADENTRSHEEHERQMSEIRRLREARNAVRPALVEGLKNLLAGIADEGTIKHHENMDEMITLVNASGQTFTIKIQVWNGDHR
jgi:hypothetical protein